MPPLENGPSSNPLKKVPKPVLIVGGSALLVLVYVWYKNRQNSNSNAAANPYGSPMAGSGVLNPIVITQPGGGSGSGDNTTTTGTSPSSTPTTTPTSTSTDPGLRQITNVPGVPAATLAGVNADAYNYLIHNPAPGYTGLSWSKLSPAEKINVYNHIPVSYLNASGSKVKPGQTQSLNEIINELQHRPKVTAASTPAAITSRTR